MKKQKKEKLNISMSKSKGNNKCLIALFVVIGLLFFTIISFTIINKFSRKIYKNIYLGDNNISNYTADELEELLNKWNEDAKQKSKVIIKENGNEIDSVIAEEVNFQIDVPKTKEKIYSYGREKNIFLNDITIFKLLFQKKIFDLEYIIDGQKLDQKAQLLEGCIKNKVIDDAYELDDINFKLIITKGKKGSVIDFEQVKKDIIKKMKERAVTELELKVTETKPKDLDVNQIYKAVYRKPVNAEVKEVDGKKKFVKEVYGLDFDKTDLKNKIALLKEAGSVLEYNLEVSAPLTKLEDINWSSYDDVLGSVTTAFETTNKSKSTNMNIALTYLNGKVIMPGEVFSYNRAVGDITAAKGYVNGGTYQGTSIVDGIGGGICQTVSTLYNAALYANLEIVARSQHSMPVTYVKPSLDATMYYPQVDLKFKNNRNFPIKIKTTYSWTGNINISILGTKEEDDVEVELVSNVLSEIPYTTKTIIDSTMETGKEMLKQKGSDGYTSEAYRITRRNGIMVKKELLSKDYYKPIQKIVVKGPDSGIEE